MMGRPAEVELRLARFRRINEAQVRADAFIFVAASVPPAVAGEILDVVREDACLDGQRAAPVAAGTGPPSARS
jgi:hypothetical protein